MTFKPRTTDQNKRIFGLAAPLRMSHDDLRELAADVTGGRVERLSALSFDEANALIKRLGGEPLPASAALSTRSQQLARQKAGVDVIVTQAQINRMETLWFARDGRTAAGLTALCQRVNKGTSSPRTTKECNRVIEAIKSMNSRPTRQEAA